MSTRYKLLCAAFGLAFGTFISALGGWVSGSPDIQKPVEPPPTLFTRSPNNGCDYLTAYQVDGGSLRAVRVLTVFPALDQPVTCKYDVLQPKTKR